MGHLIKSTMNVFRGSCNQWALRGNSYAGCATTSQAGHSESALTEPHLRTTRLHQESHKEALSDPWCSSSSSITLVMELLRIQPYASLLMMSYSTDRSSCTRTMSNYKMTSTSWWTGPQHGIWNLTLQSATPCTSLPSTRKEQHALPPTPWVLTLERVSDSKYLGVTLNEHLEWSTHTQITAGKAHITLTFLERNLRVVPQHLRERAYLVIVRPVFLSTPQLSLTLTSPLTSSTSTPSSDMLLDSWRTTHEEDMTPNKTKSVWQPFWKTSDGTTSPLVTNNQDVPWCTRYWLITLPSKRIWGPYSARATCALLRRASSSTPGPNLPSMDTTPSRASSGTGTAFPRHRGLHPHMRSSRRPSTSNHAPTTVFILHLLLSCTRVFERLMSTH